ncbi:MAG: hypothetical protein ACXABY_29990 [Candidatus Thorarchaeota archaeon]
MSDYHILTQAVDPINSATVVFHYQVPAVGNNSAGIQWQNAVKMNLFGKDGSGTEISVFSVLPRYHVTNYPGGISSAEETLIVGGEVVEEIQSVRFSSVNLTPAQRRAEIEAAHTAWAAALEAKLMVELDWIGYRGDVP